ncbi:LysR family transcriptional regulator [Scandinavium sp. V105_16]|uniref:LysR family transcriptional regulator n=1 Tax=Scandinavium lactucae TaxID=3095028 RepID=A0AAJ2S6N3_9ENTR|nr:MULTISPECIES: LysR family transcriptional regulator [unclassified Scandinavium]MDX6020131.1 LysR family transcriptional regulator [Scandinavium sp. V105_16]MDX6032120.1 LysR family transcriptional regulator [Scandinavium sp. V105_12]
MNEKTLSRDFDYNLIKVLDAVISAGNATKAAKQLSVTPAAVSLALNRLQSFYNEALFVRGKEGLVPTMKALEVHASFRQVIDLVQNTITPEPDNLPANQITILGGDLVENYYLSQLYDNTVFENNIFKHFSNRNLTHKEMKRLLLAGHSDLIVSPVPFTDNDIDCRLIDSFKNFCCICSRDNLLAGVERMSLHNFYSARHAIYHSSLFSAAAANDSHLYNEDITYQGNRIKSYQSDSIAGIINIIEQTSLIALFPLKLAVFHKNQRKSAINIIQPPSEMTFRPINIYASWKKKKPRSHMVEDIVAMLHTLSSFRR